MEIPSVHYARSGEFHIAYQVLGAGPIDLVLVPGWISHLEVAWEQPRLAHSFRRLASFSRLILVDKRGTGLSDRVSSKSLPTLEDRMEDLHAVLDAVGSSRTVLYGISEGGPLCMLFAATYPERTTALVVYGSWARALKAPDYDWGFDPIEFESFLASLEPHWGDGAAVNVVAPSLAHDEQFCAWWGRFERMAASPGAAVGLLRMGFEGDVRHVLPAIFVPTLVLHRAHDAFVDVRHGRYIAEHIPGARYVELEGGDHFPLGGDLNAVDQQIENFLSELIGVRRGPSTDRVLATVLFTDVVGSTERAVALGDEKWKKLIAIHDDHVRMELARYRGKEIKTIGDGFLVTFDGPGRAICCADAIRNSVRSLGLEIRSGLHTGEIEMMANDIAGIAVNIAARVSALAGPGEILVSSTVKDLVVGSRIEFIDRGSHVLKGVPGEWHLFAAVL
ncbi:adenylate/guanylate cyclase domain-containing protein [Nitrosomonas nitrosa]|uniref:adenylate/guanylate cyclase domain-containing protein n=1 Tax=Nitrosomonas nitrosa TaxID=52442 RepID=UPI0023F69EEF|nr:adenylate/guanylate cyclase domain-containing protein [Nitrosomonas nitrosa]MCO6433580.1 adenylate/guanylate cyclase domain-containing protein [Nitrosomonas nitrosa]